MRGSRSGSASAPRGPHAAATLGFSPGLNVLLQRRREWLIGRRLGLLSHRAAVAPGGRPSAEVLHDDPDIVLAALFGPEHGFAGDAAAGAPVPDAVHPQWGIPIYSLYGSAHRPTPAMLDTVDLLLVDVQDLGARPYTYGSTLRSLIEAAAAAGKPVIVADRPVPLQGVADGPLLDPVMESFVGFLPTPMVHGLTPGETAQWLRSRLGLTLDLRVVPYEAAEPGPCLWPDWVPPSPRIVSRAAARCYPVTVAGEALPALDYGSGTDMPFQVLGSPWLDGDALVEAVAASGLPGIQAQPHVYRAAAGPLAGMRLRGIRLTPRPGPGFRPVQAAVCLLSAAQTLMGKDRLWRTPGTRPEFFDKLFGTSGVREALLDGDSGAVVAARWEPQLAGFRAECSPFLLYEGP
jgi:uncharacterized protein YbbC (DUF1343 family)